MLRPCQLPAPPPKHVPHPTPHTPTPHLPLAQEMCPGFKGSLRDYQLKGVKWLISLWSNGLNGILADQMGLGKTVGVRGVRVGAGEGGGGRQPSRAWVQDGATRIAAGSSPPLTNLSPPPATTKLPNTPHPAEQVQTIGFLCHLRNTGHINGPYMVLGPLSTLTNWVSEFERWAPDFPVVLYHGSKAERQQIRAKRMPTGAFCVLVCVFVCVRTSVCVRT